MSHRYVTDELSRYGIRGRPRQPFFLSENEGERYFMLYKNVSTSFFRFVTMHTFDRQRNRRTDGRTERPSQYRALCVALNTAAR